MGHTGEIYRRRFPEIALMIEDNGRMLRYPEGPQVQLPAGPTGNVSGVGTQGAHYFAWSQVVKDGTRCTAATPLTRRHLGEMVPALGRIFFLQVCTARLYRRTVTVGVHQL